MKKIWLLAFEFTPFPGGQATYATEIARAFCRAGYEVIVVAPCYLDIDDTPEKYKISRIFRHQKLDIFAILAIFNEFRSVSEQDVVLAADIRAGIVTSLLRMFKKFKKILMFHGGEIKRAENSYLAKLINRFSAMFAANIVVNSSYTARLVRQYIGCEPVTTLLGVSPYWFEPAIGEFENETLRALDPTIPIVCTVARLESRKGHLFAMKALRDLSEQTSLAFHYIICGKAVSEDYARLVLAEVEACRAKFTFVGVLSKADVRRLYARSKVHLLAAHEEPGFVEGFGLVITEAGAQSCPSIATRVGGIPDAIIDRETGLLVDEYDLDGVISCLELVLTDEVEKKRLGQGARNYSKSLTWDDVAHKTLIGQ